MIGLGLGFGLGLARAGGGGALNPDKLSLDLAFALDKTLTARKGPTPTFTRASTATFVGSNGLIQSAAINEPRFDHDPVTLASKGLLIEGSRTNLISHSENIADSAWSAFTSATASSNQATSPNGAETASSITAIATASSTVRQRIRITNLSSGSSQRTASAFIKAGTHEFGFVSLAFNKSGIGAIRSSVIRLKFSDGSFVQTGTIEGFSASVTPFQNDWYRITISAVSDASLAVEDQAVISLGVSFNKEGDSGEFVGTETIFAWGAQLEEGSFPTSYIPTTTASVVRSADVCSITGADFTSFYNQSEGTWVVDFIPESSTSTLQYLVDKNTFAVPIVYFVDDKIRAGLNQVFAITDSTPLERNELYMAAFAYKAGDYGLSVNGSAVTTSNNAGNPTALLTEIIFGSRGGSTINSPIARIQYFRKRLLNAKLQTLTAP